MKKILALLLSSTTGLIIVAIIILVPILMIMDFFGANIKIEYLVIHSNRVLFGTD